MSTLQSSNSLLLLVDDKPENLDVLIHHLEDIGHDMAVALSGEAALNLAKEQLPCLILLDVMMPGIDGFETCVRLKENPLTKDIPVIFMSALSDTQNKVKGFEVGGIDFITKPFQREEVIARISAHLTIQHQRQLLQNQNQALTQLNAQLTQQIHQTEQAEHKLHIADHKLSALSEQEAKQWGIDTFIGSSQIITTLLQEVRALQQADKTNVLVLGESGTGKELISRAIHFGSKRLKNAFVAVNCSAIPGELADAEFFGHKKGAFTGATSDRSGYFVQADGGTLFLDEIGDLPLSLQAKLLRVLEDGIVSPVGSNTSSKVDVKIIAATNVDLRSKVKDKTFRQDLYYRLAGYVIKLPALHQRQEDIPALSDHFLTLLAQQMGREKSSISNTAMHALQQYSFPGNVRELKNLIEHALISSQGQMIAPHHLHFIDDLEPAATPSQAHAITSTPPPSLPKKDVENIILSHVKKHGKIDNSSAQEILNIEHGRASYLLKKLHGEGKLTREGQRRWAYYILAD